MILHLALLVGVIFSASTLQAKVFNISNESFAAYIRGTAGPSLDNTLAKNSSGSGATVDSEHSRNLSGEFGFLYASPIITAKFGIEIVRPFDIKDTPGISAAGVDLYTMSSEISVMIPKAGLEFNLYNWPTSRLLLSGTAGYASLVARNSYTMTAAGTAATGVTDFNEDMRASVPTYEGSLGYEHLLTDSTTIAIEGGYRSLVFDEVSFNSDTTNFQGAVSKDDRAKNMDGTRRTLDMSNYFLGLYLRFWIQ